MLFLLYLFLTLFEDNINSCRYTSSHLPPNEAVIYSYYYLWKPEMDAGLYVGGGTHFVNFRLLSVSTLCAKVCQ
jgi:hypothetical protein